MGLDSFLARVYRRIPGRDFLAREVQKGAAFVSDSTARVAFLDGVPGAPLAPPTPFRLVHRTLDAEEALLKSAFRKISRVGSLTGGTKWYLSMDCLLAAKRMMYSVEYRRFYLRDLDSIVVWPNRIWLWRMALAAALFGPLGVVFWKWVDTTTGAIIGGVGLAWVAVELALGPTAGARICTRGTIADLPLVARTRRARKVLAKIDAAVRATRGDAAQPVVPVTSAQPAEPSVQTNFEAPPGIVSVADATKTNGS